MPAKTPPLFLSRLWDILSEELGLGQKHILAAWLNEGALFQSYLAPRVHWFSLLNEQEEPLLDALKKLDSDAFDAFLYQGALGQESKELQKEFRRILRLNSHVVILQERLWPRQDAFSTALAAWRKAFSAQQDMELDAFLEQMQDFFQHGFQSFFVERSYSYQQEQLFASQQQLLDGLDAAKRKQAQKALHLLFLQYQKQGQVELQLRLDMYAGLYNRYTPAISLRKSIFFYLLKPFAFSFYVLVKLNIYIWRFLYRLRGRE